VRFLVTYQRADWNKCCKIYLKLQEQQLVRIDALKQAAFGQQSGLQYEAGIIAWFSGIHPQTNSKVLKVQLNDSLQKLFEMVSSVSFVDYETGSESGHVRFKTPFDAEMAVNYYTRACIYQDGPNDTTGKLDPSRSRSHFFNCTRHRDSFPDAIYLTILTGKSEDNYWDELKSMKTIVTEPEIVMSEAPSSAMPFSRKEKRKAEHVTFDASDSDDGLLLGIDQPKRKPRHRKEENPLTEKRKRKRH
jgi:hypothetical protein